MDPITRDEFSALGKRIDELKADTRDAINIHADDDRREFSDVRQRLGNVEKILAEWTGALSISKWALGLGIPAILGAVVTHVVRHW